VPKTWEDLPESVRAEVLRLASAGRHHADFQVAEAAYVWARDQSTSRVGILMEAVIDGATGSYGGASQSWSRRREALLLRELGVPTNGPYCPECNHSWAAHPAGTGTCSQCRAADKRGLLIRPACTISAPSQ